MSNDEIECRPSAQAMAVRVGGRKSAATATRGRPAGGRASAATAEAGSAKKLGKKTAAKAAAKSTAGATGKSGPAKLKPAKSATAKLGAGKSGTAGWQVDGWQVKAGQVGDRQVGHRSLPRASRGGQVCGGQVREGQVDHTQVHGAPFRCRQGDGAEENRGRNAQGRVGLDEAGRQRGRFAQRRRPEVDRPCHNGCRQARRGRFDKGGIAEVGGEIGVPHDALRCASSRPQASRRGPACARHGRAGQCDQRRSRLTRTAC